MTRARGPSPGRSPIYAVQQMGNPLDEDADKLRTRTADDYWTRLGWRDQSEVQ